MTGSTHWWHDAVGYMVYLPSFADTDGDGFGDLAGVTLHLDHLADLGVNLLWVTPFYPSPMADFGYDVADYCAVDPRFGDLDTFDHLLAEAHARGIRVIIDLVPNHTSRQHPWFQAALADPGGPYHDYYLWRDPAADSGPPNNWVSFFGGRTWTLEPGTGQYYLHLFLAEQPDLNWRNPAVLDEFDTILRFWLERGIDGFRIDAAQTLIKDADLRSNPQIRRWESTAARGEQWDSFEHVHDILQPETHAIFQRWQGICQEYDAFLVGETYVLDPQRFGDLLQDEGLHAGFWFGPMQIQWQAAQIRQTLGAPLAHAGTRARVAWLASSQDEPRAPTRFGGGELGRRRAFTFVTLLFCLPGLPFLYQGEELGLVDGIVPPECRADPVGADVTLSRDGCRTPMPWRPGPAFGFSDSEDTWLPDGGRTDSDTASVQRASTDSWFARYRSLVRFRSREPELRSAALEWLSVDSGNVVAFRRGTLVIMANVGDDPLEVPIDGELVFTTTPLIVDAHRPSSAGATHVVLPGSEALVIRTT